MATFGHRIAVTDNDGMVGIYDSVTGVLRLSLNFKDSAQAMRGSPDGSVLFCAHKTSSITAWDMQTGGLIHSFDLERNAEEIAVSSKGRYLAYGSSGGFVEVLEVANTMKGAVIWACSLITHFCWLEPEERIAVSTDVSVHIWDIVTGTVLESFTIRHPADRMVYSQKFNQLAIMGGSPPGAVITIINLRNGTRFPSHMIPQKFSCFAFSQTSEELVYGMETHGLQLFNVSTQNLKKFEYPNTMTSVSCLQNGTVVANFMGSGIQLLSLDGGDAPSQQATISALAVHVFDDNRIIAVFPTSRDHIILLKLAPMSQLLKIPIRNTYQTPTDPTTILCASYGNRMAVYCFKVWDTGFLQLWRFYEEFPRWTVEVNEVAEIGRLSPGAAQLVTIHTVGRLSRVCVWNTHLGELEAHLDDIPPPLSIEFIHDTEFCLQYNTHYVSYRHPDWKMSGWGEGVPPSRNRLQRRRDLDVDDTHEWVVNGLKRICWIPPGYIGSIQPSYHWVEHSLVMIGQDGTLRAVTFSPCSEE